MRGSSPGIAISATVGVLRFCDGKERDALGGRLWLCLRSTSTTRFRCCVDARRCEGVAIGRLPKDDGANSLAEVFRDTSLGTRRQPRQATPELDTFRLRYPRLRFGQRLDAGADHHKNARPAPVSIHASPVCKSKV